MIIFAGLKSSTPTNLRPDKSPSLQGLSHPPASLLKKNIQATEAHCLGDLKIIIRPDPLPRQGTPSSHRNLIKISRPGLDLRPPFSVTRGNAYPQSKYALFTSARRRRSLRP